MSDHPLTDKICRDLTGHMIYYSPTVFNDMRAAYDLGLQAGRDEQLEQCVEWLARLDPKYALATHSTLARMMKDAMRPTAQEEES